MQACIVYLRLHTYVHNIYIAVLCIQLYNIYIYIYTNLCPGHAPGAGHSALTQQNVHGWESTVTVHNIPSGRGNVKVKVRQSLCGWALSGVVNNTVFP